MSFFDTLQEATLQERQTLFNLPIIRDALGGQVSLASYRSFLIQAYYHVRHTVPLMMACGARLPTHLEWLRKAVCEYIDEEYGHEQWVLDDIAACGGDKDAVRNGQPSLPIELMVSYLYDLIARGNPVGLFGMVYLSKIAMAAIENVTVSSAADEEHSFHKTERAIDQKDHASQMQSSSLPGDVGISAGKT